VRSRARGEFCLRKHSIKEASAVAVSSYVITSNNVVLDRNDWLDQRKEDTLEPDIQGTWDLDIHRL
jgi:hypothetical protein